jgi:hypothetical protein
MARMFIPFATEEAKNEFVSNVANTGDVAAYYGARALATTGKLGPGESYGIGYIDFLLQRANEQLQEKSQVVDVLSDNYVSYFFGQAPPMFQYSGILLNSHQDSWRAAFTSLYHHVLRGTKMARNKTVVTLSYDDVMVTGVLTDLSQLLTAELELAVTFNFSMLVKRYDINPRYIDSVTNPTLVKTFPYNMEPGLFTDRKVEAVNATLADAGEIRFTTTERKKPAETAVDSSGLEAEPLTVEDEYKENTVYNSDAVKELREKAGPGGAAVADNLLFFTGE